MFSLWLLWKPTSDGQWYIFFFFFFYCQWISGTRVFSDVFSKVIAEPGLRRSAIHFLFTSSDSVVCVFSDILFKVITEPQHRRSAIHFIYLQWVSGTYAFSDVYFEVIMEPDLQQLMVNFFFNSLLLLCLSSNCHPIKCMSFHQLMLYNSLLILYPNRICHSITYLVIKCNT